LPEVTGPPSLSIVVVSVLCSSILVVDPTAEEESLCTSTITVVTDEEEGLCAPHKPGGGTSLSGEKLQDCISRATTRHREICKLIDKFLQSVKTAE
uniref:Exoribonuclease phosphorolytic domain-containing protein n=1 Tax=Oncorhynchus mykiss TaxID=8022 RepID=A0A8K9UKW5_ONCMY